MELLAACVFAYFLMRHGPQIIAEAMAEVEYAKRGEMSAAYEARLRRLEAAGIDPATGGAFRQYVGNTWRDAWLDAEERRAKRRADRRANPDRRDTWWERFNDRLDEAMSARSDRWRQRSREDVAPPVATVDSDDATPPAVDDPAPVAGAPAPPPAPPPAAPNGEPEVVDATPAAGDATQPVRVDSVAGEPIRTEPQQSATPEGAPMSNAVVAVTGVVSGAAEARAIAAQTEAAATAFIASLAKIRGRIQNLGDSAAASVQLAHYSQVVAAINQAAEAAAAAQAQARACGAEVIPALLYVAKAFDRINS